MNATLQTARGYLAAGYSVIPVRLDGTKSPDGRWEPFQKRRSTYDELSAWFPDDNTHGIGLVQGAVSSNAEMLEFETQEAFKEWEQTVCDHGHEDLLERLNLRVRSGGGGIHFYYRCPDGIEGNLKLARFTDGAVKIETRGEGGQVVAPGSPTKVHRSGNPYTQLEGGYFSAVPTITGKERAFLFAMAKNCNEHTSSAKTFTPKTTSTKSPTGNRPGDDYNARTTQAEVIVLLEGHGWQVKGGRGDVCDLTRPGKSPHEGASGTVGYCGKTGFYCFTTSAPPFEAETYYAPFSVYGLLEHGGRFDEAARELGKRGYGEKKYCVNLGVGTDKTDKTSSDGGFVSFVSDLSQVSPVFLSTPKSLRVDLLPVPKLTEDLLPPPLAEWVFDIAERVGCPPEFVAIPAIIALGSVVGRKIGIRPKKYDSWTVVPNLWGAVVGRPGALKTPGTSEAVRPLQWLEDLARETHARQVNDWQGNTIIKKSESKQAQKDLDKGQKLSQEAKLALALKVLDDEAGEEPVCRRFLVNDTTVEKLGELLKENPDGLLQYRDELTGFLRSLEKQGHETDRAFYLEAWNGTGGFTCDRIGRGTVYIPSMTVSLFGTIQPGPLAFFLRRAVTEGNSDGFIPRLQLLVWPDPMPYNHVDRLPNRVAGEKVRTLYQRMAYITHGVVEAKRDNPDDAGEIPHLHFDDDAQAVFDDWRMRLEATLAADHDSGMLIEHLSKYRSLMPSLALLFHLAAGGRGPVSVTATKLAIHWCSFLEAHARRVYQCAMDGEPEAAERLGGKIKAGLPNPFTARDVVRKGWTGLTDSAVVDVALGILEDRGWLVSAEVKPLGEGGRPTTYFYINPELTTDKTDKTPPVIAEDEPEEEVF